MNCLGSAAKKLFPKPLSFEAGSIGRRDRRFSLFLAKIIEQSSHRYEATILATQSMHQFLELLADNPILHEAVAKMGVHDAGTALGFEAVLLVFRNGAQKSGKVGSLGSSI